MNNRNLEDKAVRAPAGAENHFSQFNKNKLFFFLLQHICSYVLYGQRNVIELMMSVIVQTYLELVQVSYQAAVNNAIVAISRCDAF